MDSTQLKGTDAIIIAPSLRLSCSHLRRAVVPFVHSGFDKVFPGKAKLPRPGQSVRILVGEPLGFEDLTAAAQHRGWSEEALQSAIAARIGKRLCALKAELDGLPIAEVMGSQFELDAGALRPLIGEPPRPPPPPPLSRRALRTGGRTAPLCSPVL